jgi:2Fe-2S ferredoxin
MGGQNPYIEDADVRLPTRKYTIRFIDEAQREHVVEVDPARIPYGDHGLPGSLLDIALAHDVEIDHACGGVCACSTCHVIVKEGLDACSEATDDEEDQLDQAYGLTSQSRLACQCVPDGTKDLVVVVPSWNRNLAREGHA